MPNLVPIVEGDGEVIALPILLRRLLPEVHKVYDWQITKPKNARGCGNLTTKDGLERFVRLALSEPDCDGILVLLDADAIKQLPNTVTLADNCSSTFAYFLAQRVKGSSSTVPIAIVVVRWEYEAWFLASLETLAGHCGLSATAQYQGDVETEQNPKGWLQARFLPDHRYSETRDQVALSTRLDFDLVSKRSRSFRRLKNALKQILDAYAQGNDGVTPLPETTAGDEE